MAFVPHLPPAPLLITTSLIGGCTVVTVQGEVDLSTSADLRDSLNAALDTAGTSIVLDLSGVTFLDSTALGILIGAHRRARDLHGSLSVVSARPMFAKMLGITGLDQLLEVFPTLDDALAQPPGCAGSAHGHDPLSPT